MSRKKVALVLAIYFLVALGVGTAITLTAPFASQSMVGLLTGRALGFAIGAFVVAGILPLIFWAFGRFRLDKASAPLGAWALLGILYMGLSVTGTIYDRNEKIIKAAKSITALSGNDYEAFLRSTTSSCVNGQRASALNQRAGITEPQINRYCTCFAETLAKQVTVDEVVDYAKTGQLPPTMQAKAYKIAPDCNRLALGR